MPREDDPLHDLRQSLANLETELNRFRTDVRRLMDPTIINGVPPLPPVSPFAQDKGDRC